MKELDPALYTIAWIAPLQTEAQAARQMLDNLHDGRFSTSRGDDYIFSAGDINGHNIVIATLPAGQEYGTGSAASLASQIKKFFTNLWFGLLVGVVAGLPNLRKTPPIDIRLGDVLVGLPEGDSAGIVAYDLGKETTESFQLLRSGQVLANTETVVRSAIGSIKIKAPYDTDIFPPFYDSVKDKEHSRGTFADPGQERDIFYDIGDDGVDSPVQRLQRPTDRRTRVWYGSIGSGDHMIESTLRRNEMRDRYGVIGLEMAAAGIMNRIPVGVIRGVCDYADQHKNTEWQPYAAAMAAAYAKAVIYEFGWGKAASSSDVAKQEIFSTILSDRPPITDRFLGREAGIFEKGWFFAEYQGQTKHN
ncbi:related to calcium-independent phospholipase A2 [Fusarium fujikuroi IMI 58289]|uniref:Related to calcium-independent phospholipase A2 n=1 Tax=Gibberella fujikuroi (strain CBS 195.34 / IMI 58289 / NRRL A-6831) TaxID=1279085 RepID=S0EIE0_GIBF5|nr:related to calcium-independent phospholipase A2 [Fusarium fujikuroi IMI 58289]KLP18907.1 calcium-independent phospholipase A2 [Fusarium fujikuroi]CCT72143.1 related to calcium-independent phospholipase A2 [Fusarium fujikuroi IMI 58289]SCO18428.1 related to calcium-independent phospholipase A2 [Fusarium fujikuroi]